MRKMRTPMVGFGFTMIVASIPALITFALFYGVMFSDSPMIKMTSGAVIVAIAIREFVRLVNRWSDPRPETQSAIIRRILRWAIRRNNPDCIVPPAPARDRPRD